MSEFGLIARADRGGLSAQTWEVYRHLKPRRVLLVDLGEKGRGPCDPELYEDAYDLRVTTGFPSMDDAEWLLRPSIRSVFSVEGIYGEAMRAALADEGTRLVLQANPELYVPADLAGTNLELVLPTSWEADRFPEDTRILPVPVNTAELEPISRSPAEGELRLFHPAGAAMADRNGTREVIAAARALRHPAMLGIANRSDLERRKLGRALLMPLPEERTYLGHWAPERRPDMLVLPRRYGGLCLPMQEAAACGVPIVTSALEPQASWVPEAGLVRVKRSPARVAMKGGTFSVHSVDHRALAATIDAFIASPELRAEAGEQARAWAEDRSWETLASEYLNLLCS